MNVKVHDVMIDRVITAEPHHTVERVRGLLERNGIHAVPIVGPDGEAVGMVSSADLAREQKATAPVSSIMNERVYKIPRYDDVTAAARAMRNHKIHHLVVTHEQQVVGILSSLDLLQLIEGRRFVAKNAPTEPKRKRSRRP